MPGPILIYVHDLRASGVVANALAIARRVASEREVLLVAGHGVGLHQDAEVAPARLEVIEEGGSSKLSPVGPLKQLVKAMEPALLLSAGNLGHGAVWLAARATRCRTAYRISNAVDRPGGGLRTRIRRAWHARLARDADLLLLVGQSLKDRPPYAAAMASGRAVVIPNGIDVDRARRLAREPAPHPWLADKALPVVMAVGRIHPQKNLPMLLDAAALAMAARPFRLVLVGRGPDQGVAALKAQAKGLGIAGQVLFAGEQANVFAWLKRADLFALVSRWEGSSNALLEAMAVGTPVLASRQAGDASVVLGDGRFGLLVDGDSEAAIAHGILRQLDRPVKPGKRAEDYRLTDTLDAYALALSAF
jgi:glycosyltransferase involved in cell wall biosynthesis